MLGNSNKSSRKKGNLARRMSLILSGIVIVSVTILIAYSSYEQFRHVRELSIGNYKVLTHLMSAQMSGGIKWGKPSAIYSVIKTISSEKNTPIASIIAFDLEGNLLTEYSSDSLRPYNIPLYVLSRAKSLKVDEFLQEESQEHILFVTPSAAKQGSEVVGYVAVAWSLENIKQEVREVVIKDTIVLFAISLFLLFIIHYAMRFVVKPINDIARAMGRYADGDKEIEIPALGRNDEVGQLAYAFWNMVNDINHSKEEIMRINESLERRVNDRTRDLAKAKEEAEIASDTKSEFLSNMSHELRTPLNSLLILASSLARNKEKNLSESQVEALNIIKSSGTDLLDLINEILDLAKVESGKIVLNNERIVVSEMVESLKKQFEHIAEEKKLDFAIHVKSDVPEEFISDGQRIEQVIRNFLSNAFKFTLEGGITITIFNLEEEKKFTSHSLKAGEAIAISVVDTGIGIPKEKRESIFQAFKQVDGSISRKYGGTGLGLSICLKMATLLGGGVSVESSEGKGSTFTFYLPIKPQQGSEDTKKESRHAITEFPQSSTASLPADIGNTPASEEIRNVDSKHQDMSNTILVIEDDKRFSKILCDMIESHDCKYLVAYDGITGLQLASTYKPGAIISDIELPGMNGLEVMERLKADASTGGIPVYVMSVHDESMKATEKGAVGYLTKPISEEELQSALEKIQQMMCGALRKLLVVEDNDALRYTMRMLLEEHDIEVLDAGSAEDAIEVLKQNSVDCMLMDIRLPGMSGIELLEKISSDETIKDLPVVAYSGKELTESEKQKIHNYTEIFIQKIGKEPEYVIETMLERMRVSSVITAVSVAHPTVSSVAGAEQSQKVRPDFSMNEEISSSLIIEDEKEAGIDVKAKHVEPVQEAKDKKVDSNMNSQADSSSSAETDLEAVLDQKRVLIVDDDMRNTYALSVIFESESMEVFTASNGQKALELLDSQDVDIVLMDIMMPVMDGFEAIKSIRLQKRFAHLPVIAVTAKAMKEDKERCLEVGADGYISKPVDQGQLFDLMRNLLG